MQGMDGIEVRLIERKHYYGESKKQRGIFSKAKTTKPRFKSGVS